MKTASLTFILFTLILLTGCNNSNCPPESLTNQDIAGYLDGSTGILFTTSTDRESVLSNLNATPFEDKKGLYKMPVFIIDETQVYMIFDVEEVDNPSEFLHFQYDDYCYADILNDFENELLELIETDDENIENQIIIACGDVLGEISNKENNKEKNIKGKEKEALEKLKEKKQEENALKKELAETAKEQAEKVKEALDNGDKNGAKEKAKELVDKTKEKLYLHFNYPNCEDWNFGMDYGQYWTPNPTEIPPDLINQFSHDNIRYKVYKNAKCGPGPPTIAFQCYRHGILDSVNPPPPIWMTEEYLPRKVCERGSGFCVEQEVVIELIKEYSDDSCKRLINVKPVKDFACFD